ncbi:tetraspanin-16 isoform X1 [Choloepus didactylus]|uniref:tetraspanin-16 isoform X1 n=1 Tax=Choloepus didactylus TaxID=27675 RepID=UPI0018A0ABDB|nr:tetraspanin-16 isoform X1 [Choloepus didactylus]
MAEAHTPYSSLKKLLFFLNGLMAMSGGLLVGLSAWVKCGGSLLTRVFGLSSVYLLHISYLCLVMGCIVMLLGFAGWYGATKESRSVLFICFLLLVIILLVEIVVATGIFVFFPIVEDMAREHILATLRKNYRGYNEPGDFSTEWNLVMEKLRCCGVNNYTDFSGSAFQTTTGHSYPRSCCKSVGTTACDGLNVSSEIIHQEGCFPKLLKISKIQSFALSGGSLGAAVMQLPGILATLLLFAKLA